MDKLGLYLGTKKWGAILRGDTSNAVVNRHFVYCLQAAGMYLCGAPGGVPAIVRLQARYSQQAWETLVEIYETEDQKLKIQGVLVLVYILVIIGFAAGPPLYLSKVCNFIESANLQFLPVYGRPLELSEQVRGDAAILSQAIYMENYLYLALGGPAPVMTARIEREFRMDLQVRVVRCAFVVWLEICLVIWSSERIHFCLIFAR